MNYKFPRDLARKINVAFLKKNSQLTDVARGKLVSAFGFAIPDFSVKLNHSFILPTINFVASSNI